MLGSSAIRSLLQNTHSIGAIVEAMSRRQLDSIVQWRGCLLLRTIFGFLCHSLMSRERHSTSSSIVELDNDRFVQVLVKGYFHLYAQSDAASFARKIGNTPHIRASFGAIPETSLTCPGST